MARSSYAELLTRPEWQKKRLEVLGAAGWKCELCGNRTLTLHVHHTNYIRGRKPWEYDMAELLCICQVCHGKLHRKAAPVPESKPVEWIAPKQKEKYLRQRLALKRKLDDATTRQEQLTVINKIQELDRRVYGSRP